MKSLDGIESFAKLLHAVERVQRVSRRPDEREMTTTAEHTFELAMVCWYIVSTNKLNLDLGKVLQFALAHDVVEAYAGDTYIYDEEAKKTKEARERAALERIQKEFTEFPELSEVIHEYELRTSPEAKLVYAADKLIDPLNASLEETQSIWKDFNVSFKSLLEHKRPKVALSPVIAEYWEALEKKLSDRKSFFFLD
jgi:putative hydrolase of HD superfamily